MVSGGDDAGQVLHLLQLLRAMVEGDGIDERLREAPTLREASADIDMGVAQQGVLRIGQGDVLCRGLDDDVAKGGLELVEDAGGERFLRLYAGRLPRYLLGEDGGGDGVAPEEVGAEGGRLFVGWRANSMRAAAMAADFTSRKPSSTTASRTVEMRRAKP